MTNYKWQTSTNGVDWADAPSGVVTAPEHGAFRVRGTRDSDDELRARIVERFGLPTLGRATGEALERLAEYHGVERREATHGSFDESSLITAEQFAAIDAALGEPTTPAQRYANVLNRADSHNTYVPTGPTTITATGGTVGVRASLPKPSRVEKWQRWSCENSHSGRPSTVEGIRGIDAHFGGSTYGDIKAMLAFSHWHFLGYAKPDKVEVGQRWKHSGGEYHEIASVAPDDDGHAVTIGFEHGKRFRLYAAALLRDGPWQYLGMADGHVIGVDTTREESVGAVCASNVINALLAEQEQLARGIVAMFTQWLTWTRCPKLQSELAAKRLIANQPEWAYRRAWTCAVLAVQDWFMARGIDGDLASYANAIEQACRLAHDRRPCNLASAFVQRRMYDAYTRGMEKPAGLLQRPRKHYGSDDGGSARATR